MAESPDRGAAEAVSPNTPVHEEAEQLQSGRRPAGPPLAEVLARRGARLTEAADSRLPLSMRYSRGCLPL
jgi:hypothetical protein